MATSMLASTAPMTAKAPARTPHEGDHARTGSSTAIPSSGDHRDPGAGEPGDQRPGGQPRQQRPHGHGHDGGAQRGVGQAQLVAERGAGARRWRTRSRSGRTARPRRGGRAGRRRAARRRGADHLGAAPSRPGYECPGLSRPGGGRCGTGGREERTGRGPLRCPGRPGGWGPGGWNVLHPASGEPAVELPELDYRPTVPGALHRAAELFGDDPYIVMPGRELSYRQTEVATRRVAKELLAAGVTKGTRVALHMGNSIEWIVAFYAITRIGAIGVPLSTAYKPPRAGQGPAPQRRPDPHLPGHDGRQRPRRLRRERAAGPGRGGRRPAPPPRGALPAQHPDGGRHRQAVGHAHPPGHRPRPRSRRPGHQR